MSAAARAIILAGFNRAQRVIDPGFATAGQWVVSGSGAGTTAVTGGVLAVASDNALYFARPLMISNPLEAGRYSVTFTISSYATGNISCCWQTDPALTSATNGTSRGADGTFTETLTLTAAGYIGLKGRGSAVVNSMNIDNFTVTRIG